MGKLRIAVLFIAIVVFLGSAFYIIKYYYEGYKSEQSVEDLKSLIVDEDGNVSIEEEGGETEKAEDSMHAKFAKLIEKNSDFIGWLEIPDTGINYPVMYTPNDPEFYLRKNFDKEYELSGTPFVDGACSMEPASDNIIIHGHNMKNGNVFHEMEDYKDDSFFKEHKTFKFDTIYGPGEYEIFAVILSKAYTEEANSFKYYEFVNAAGQSEFDTFVNTVRSMSLYETGVKPQYGDKLVTLSTCEYSQEDGRMAIIGRKIN